MEAYKGMSITNLHACGAFQAWEQMKDCGVNLIQLGGGSAGAVCGLQLNPNHPYGVPYYSNWAQNLETLLAKASSYGMKIVFPMMGNTYGTLFGIVSPMSGYRPISPYTSLADAEVLLDILAGNNDLSHNFLADSRVLMWCPICEARLDIAEVRSWTVGMLAMLRQRGAKTSCCVDNGVQPYYRAFPDIIPIIGDYIDFLQAHDYQEVAVINPSKNNPEVDVYQLSYDAYVHDMQYMLDTREGFPVALTEFGMGHRSDGQGWDYHGGEDNMHTKEQQAAYIKGCFDAGLATGFNKIIYFEGYWRKLYPTYHNGFGFINSNGVITNQLAYDAFKMAAVGSEPSKCLTDFDCPYGKVCVDGSCVDHPACLPTEEWDDVQKKCVASPTPPLPFVPLDSWEADPRYTNAPYTLISVESSLFLELEAENMSSRVTIRHLNVPKLNMADHNWIDVKCDGSENARILLRFFLDDGSSFDVVYWKDPATLNTRVFDLSPYAGRSLRGDVYIGLMSSDGLTSEVTISEIGFVDVAPPQCFTDFDCPKGQVCLNGDCVAHAACPAETPIWNDTLKKCVAEPVTGGCSLKAATEGTMLACYLPAVRIFRDRCLPSKLINDYYCVSMYLAPKIRKVRKWLKW